MFLLSPSFVSPYVQKYVVICACSFMDMCYTPRHVTSLWRYKRCRHFWWIFAQSVKHRMTRKLISTSTISAKARTYLQPWWRMDKYFGPSIFFFFFFFLVPVIIQWIYQLPTLEKWISFNIAIKREGNQPSGNKVDIRRVGNCL